MAGSTRLRRDARDNRAKLHAAALCASLAFGSIAPAVQAAQVHWKSSNVDYAAEGKDINDVLRDFGASQGIATRIAQGVSGNVSGKFHLPPRRFLDMRHSVTGYLVREGAPREEKRS